MDTSTIGVAAARSIDALCRRGVAYVDAPVSGGAAGARTRTLMIMYVGSDAACKAVEVSWATRYAQTRLNLGIQVADD